MVEDITASGIAPVADVIRDSGGVTRTQYYTATTIDGFIADERNSLDWLFEVEQDAAGPGGFASFFADVGAMVMGSTTYTWVFEHERLHEQPEKWRDTYGVAPTWVFTHRELPEIPDAAVSFVRGDVAPVHEEMVAAAGGKNVWVIGGGDLAGQFADAGLLDELILGVAPVTLGAGAPVLPRRLLAADLRLTSVERSGQFAYLRYDVKRR
jgi:dihydrofolate reductase